MYERIEQEFTTPFYVEGNKNGCCHDASEYIGSFSMYYGLTHEQAIAQGIKYADVYLRKDNGVCIRHSDMPSDYEGIPNIADLAHFSQHSLQWLQPLKMILESKFPSVCDDLPESNTRFALQFTDKNGGVTYFYKGGPGNLSFYTSKDLADAQLYRKESTAWEALENGYDWMEKMYRELYPITSFKAIKVEVNIVQ